ncbi:MAG: hypothetical protein JWQ98_1169 [Chlorobi bacterium]|nr:hypothetical protein [Chlorobiota bacterium]
MAIVNDHAPGTFCWWELGTTDQNAAKQFYGELFGWNHVDMPMGPDSVYTMLQREGHNIGALYQLGAQQAGAPAHWLPYVSVANADEAIGKVDSLGGTTMQPAFDVMDVGRMGLLQDPDGAVLAVWEPKLHKGASMVGSTGSVIWTELHATDAKKAGDFHAGLFNWGRHDQDFGGATYTSFLNGEKPVGGLFGMPAEGNPAHWLTFFGVDNCGESVAKATELGANVMLPPTSADGVGIFAVLADPQGAMFGILEPSMPPSNN